MLTKFTSISKGIFFLLCFTFIFSQCQETELSKQELSKSQFVDDIKSWFEDVPAASTAKNSRDLANPKVNWNRSQVLKKDNSIALLAAPLLNNSSSRNSSYQLIAFKTGHQIEGFIVELIPDKIYFDKQKAKQDRKFSGQIKILSKTGKKIRTQKFVEGQEVNFYTQSTATMRTAFGEDDYTMLPEVEVIASSWENDNYYIWIDDNYDYGSSNWDEWENDDWLYQDYDGDGDSDIGIPTEPPVRIVNNVTEPCMKQQVENAIAEGVVNEVSTLIEIFTAGEDINLQIKQASGLPASTIATTEASGPGGTHPDYIDVVIKLNSNILPNSSQEYIMATIYHELLHAVLDYNGISGTQQHQDMASQYISILTDALREHFPNLTLDEATKLTWGGLENTAAWNNLSAAERAAIKSTNQSHKAGTKGTPC